MPWDSWYDLAIREMSDLTDPAKEKLAEAAAQALPEPAPEADEEANAPEPSAEPPPRS